MLGGHGNGRANSKISHEHLITKRQATRHIVIENICPL